jgi:F0F1-type ATP synthase delta subunit
VSPKASTTPAPYILPATLIGRADLSRLVREVESLENELESQKVHNPQHATQATDYKLPKLSRSLGDFIELNKLDLTDDHVRTTLRKTLTTMKDKAPSLHMTFAIEPDPEFLQKLVTWIRQEIHPQALLTTGLQPALIGGVYLRTPNHVHDFSFKTHLKGKRDLIVHELEALRGQ